jgi:hypothetical protein
MAGCKASLVVLAISFLLERGEAFAPQTSTTFRPRQISRFDAPNLGLAATVSKNNENTSANYKSRPVDDKSLPTEMMTLPRHSHQGVNGILEKTESVLKSLHTHSTNEDPRRSLQASKEAGRANERIFANSYVDLQDKTFGFDFDYTRSTRRSY